MAKITLTDCEFTSNGIDIAGAVELSVTAEPVEDWLESREFYELMQAYRHCPDVPQAKVVDAFEAVKNAIRAAGQSPSIR